MIPHHLITFKVLVVIISFNSNEALSLKEKQEGIILYELSIVIGAAALAVIVLAGVLYAYKKFQAQSAKLEKVLNLTAANNKISRDLSKKQQHSNKQILAVEKQIRDRTLKNLANKVEKSSQYLYGQIESLFALNSKLPELSPITGLGGWAISPDLALALVKEIEKRKTCNIIEFGSGMSTVLMAQALKTNNIKGKVYSIDHLEEYANKTKQMLKLHGLTGFSEVIAAPLKPTKINKMSFKWYSLAQKFFEEHNFDVVLVDGPPEATNKLARYPSLRKLEKSLSKGSKIFIDDYRREEDRLMVELWMKEHQDLALEVLDTEKQTAVLTLN